MKNNDNEIKGKKCPNCNIFKLFEEFHKSNYHPYGRQTYCKICKKERFKESKKKSDKKYGQKWNSIPENRESKLKYSKIYQNVYPEKQKEYLKKSRQKELNKIKQREYRKKEYQNKYNIDIEWTLKLLLRNRLKNALINNFKKGKTLEFLGCCIEEFKLYLERQFSENMNWSNRGTYWEIDHIKPCDAFDLTKLEEQQKCFHYTNLQPLEKIKNRQKSNKYE